ncbi:solute carrier family 25 member 36-A isoform X1 [Hydra vulgaris]|uniref:Solute carrier family 25 member 36 n=1 Tax=Hydra vulgaris TaxID=6087 RepID=T2M7C8_HYDVU|nr:solute carrier family 25 member 36-A isoform X1 [Hydra vulgaris]
MDYKECRSSTTINFIAGAIGGTSAAIITCPLEVVKTRLQSSGEVFKPITRQITSVSTITRIQPEQRIKPNGILGCMRHIINTEGYRSLYKGLGPNLIGVAPARAVYFAVYVKSSKYIQQKGIVHQDNPLTHMLAGASAGFVTHTLTAPIWFVKTRLQLSSHKYGMMRCIAKVYKSEGIKGFYRGLSASYFGVVETIIHFVIYERLKKILREYHRDNSFDHLEKNQLTDFMLSAGCSKTCAAIFAYPHEVVRTRLRQETRDKERKYQKFFQTLVLVYKEEGRPALYGGLGTKLLCQIPNCAVMFMVYESVVFYLCENDQND